MRKKLQRDFNIRPVTAINLFPQQDKANQRLCLFDESHDFQKNIKKSSLKSLEPQGQKKEKVQSQKSINDKKTIQTQRKQSPEYPHFNQAINPSLSSQDFNIRPMSARPKYIAKTNNQEEFEQEDQFQQFSVNHIAQLTRMDIWKVKDLRKLELQVSLTDTSLQNAGISCPNVIELKLNNSTIPSLRDIGTSFQKLQILWMTRCFLKDLSGILSFPQIQEMYIAFNFVQDFSPLAYIDTLVILDAEGNQISDFESIADLQNNEDMYSLSLEGNPISKKHEYRKTVFRYLPKLTLLDDQTIDYEGDSQQDLLYKEVEEYTNFTNFEKNEEIESFQKGKPDLEQQLNEMDIIFQSLRSLKFIQKQKLSQTNLTKFEFSNQEITQEEKYSEGTEGHFVGNPLKALRHKRKRVFEENDGNQKNIWEIISHFKDQLPIDEEEEFLKGSNLESSNSSQ